jgi:hypothetical protein
MEYDTDLRLCIRKEFSQWYHVRAESAEARSAVFILRGAFLADGFYRVAKPSEIV